MLIWIPKRGFVIILMPPKVRKFNFVIFLTPIAK